MYHWSYPRWSFFSGFNTFCLKRTVSFTYAKRSNIAPKRKLIILEKPLEFLVNSLLVSEYPWDETSSCWFFKEIDCFPSQICRTGRPCHWPEPVMSLGFGCWWLWVFGGGPLRVGWTLCLLHSESLHQHFQYGYCQYSIYRGQSLRHHHSVETGTV